MAYESMAGYTKPNYGVNNLIGKGRVLAGAPTNISSYGSPNMNTTAVQPGSIGSSIMDGIKTAWGSFKDALPDIGGKDSMFNSESMFGEKGWVAPTLQGLGSLASGWAAVGQYGVAKDSLAMQQDAFNKNYVAQGRLTNAQLSDQQTRNLGNMSPERQAQALTADDYVKKYGVANV
jgi:hypothetical protein